MPHQTPIKIHHPLFIANPPIITFIIRISDLNLEIGEEFFFSFSGIHSGKIPFPGIMDQTFTKIRGTSISIFLPSSAVRVQVRKVRSLSLTSRSWSFSESLGRSGWLGPAL